MFSDLLNASEKADKIEQECGVLSGHVSTDYAVELENQTMLKGKLPIVCMHVDAVHTCTVNSM